MQQKFWRIIILLFFSSSLLLGCETIFERKNLSQTIVNFHSTPSLVNTISHFGSMTPSLEENVLHPTQILISETPQKNRNFFQPTQALTVEPTFTNKDAQDKVQALLHDNGGCQFPCWWGITPGISIWNDVRQYIYSFAFHVGTGMKNSLSSNLDRYYAYFPVDNTPTLIDSLMVTFFVDPKTGVIEAISTSQKYDISQMLTTNGPPNKILAKASGIPGTGPSAYEIELVYPQKGIELNISGDAKLVHRDNGDFTIVCLEEIYRDTNGIFLWVPKDQNLNEELQSSYQEGNRYISIFELTQIKEQTIYRWLQDKATFRCIDIPMKYWY